MVDRPQVYDRRIKRGSTEIRNPVSSFILDLECIDLVRWFEDEFSRASNFAISIDGCSFCFIDVASLHLLECVSLLYLLVKVFHNAHRHKNDRLVSGLLLLCTSIPTS